MLLDRVREAIAEETGIVDGEVATMLESGSGNRALVMSLALETQGVPHQLLLARSKVHVPAGPFLQVADFSYPLLRIELETGPTYLDPAPDRSVLGFVPFILQDGDALILWPPDESA